MLIEIKIDNNENKVFSSVTKAKEFLDKYEFNKR